MEKNKRANSQNTGRSREQKFLEIISSTLSNNTFIGDDCAFLQDFGLTITQDSLIEDVHFDLKTITPEQLGAKAILVNISDILASGAKPKYVTISLSGKLNENFIKEFYTGVDEICKEFDITVVGGDICGGQNLTISVCAIGDCKGRKISSRKNAKEDYIIAVCGIFGESYSGLKQLKCGKFDGEFVQRHIKPKLFPKTVDIIAENCKEDYALMDSSDGLYDCLEQISRKSSVKMNVKFENIPRATDDFKTTIFGGEDYCLVGCFSENDFNEIKKYDDCLIKIGTIKKGRGVFIDGIEIKEDLSYVHFKD